MVILQIQTVDIAVCFHERNPPVARDGNTPCTLASPRESVKSPTLRRIRGETVDVLGQDERCQDLAISGKQFGFHKPGIVVLKQQAKPSVAHGTNDHDEKCTVTPFRLQVPWLRRHSFSCIEPVRAHPRHHAERGYLAAWYVRAAGISLRVSDNTCYVPRSDMRTDPQIPSVKYPNTRPVK